MISKGLAPERVGFALAVTFVGGAAGKFCCGFIAERMGIIRTVLLTEAATAGGIFLVLVLPLEAIFMVLPALGAALNGTSSVLYGTVADFVAPRSLGRAFGLFYTFAITGSALGPLVFGHVSDRIDVPLTFCVVGGVALLTLPLAAILRRPISRSARS